MSDDSRNVAPRSSAVSVKSPHDAHPGGGDASAKKRKRRIVRDHTTGKPIDFYSRGKTRFDSIREKQK
jgi:hypothetical protein